DFWRHKYTSVVPAFHLNKYHWNSIILDGTVPEEDIYDMIKQSYMLTKTK
ncbi:MmcQ/YjbR family DNA-binding protein, partial [Bacillus inaquosorum]